MKKSKIVSLVLITALLASCNKPKKLNGTKYFLRSDSTADYTQRNYYPNNGFLWYYAFRPYGYYYHGAYRHAGYYSSGLHESSNIGHSSFKSGIVRGGFGSHGGFSVSS